MYCKLLLILGLSWNVIHYVSCNYRMLDVISINDTMIPTKFFNILEDWQNPASFFPPRTDNGGQPPFKYPFSFGHRTIYDGGWTRQVTVRELPLSKKMAGVQMRLIRGGIREMHWHVDAEWAYMIYGEARITAVDQHGRAFVEDVRAGDLWLFPGGVPHSLQGVGRDGAMFLLAFDSGTFSEFDTFLLIDWMKHTPRKVLAENFGVSRSVFKNLPTNKSFIFKGSMPKPLSVEKAEVRKGTGFVPQSFAFFTSKMKPNVTRDGGEVKIIDRNNFPVTNIAAAIVTLKPGGLRELHWHPNDDEWQYYVEGQAEMTVFNGNGQAKTMNFQPGDVGYIQKSLPHYVRNTGDEDLVFLEVFPTPYYEDISLGDWLAHTPSTIVNDHIQTGVHFIESISKKKAVIMP